GAGVLGGAVPPAGWLVIDLRAMDRLLDLDETALLARAEAGLLGGGDERLGTAPGVPPRHHPPCTERAPLGGLVATRSAGQFSTKYGNIEDLLLGLEAVLPSGETMRLAPVPRASTGPSLRELVLGGEGALGLAAIRRIVRVGWRPAVVRLYDQTETARTFTEWAPGDACLLLVVSEGPSTLVDVELAAIAVEARGGTALGSAPVEHWLGHRNTVPSWDFFLDKELLVDTIEIAATWDRVTPLYDAVLASLQSVPGIVVASAHSSHSYAQGTNLYITFVLKPADFAHAEEVYLAAWTEVREGTPAGGGTIAHRHGIGRLRVPWLERELGTAYPVLRAIKRALDPARIMNPGTLLAVK